MDILNMLTELIATHFTLILIWLFLGTVLKWLFYYSIVKYGVKKALEERNTLLRNTKEDIQ